MASVPVEALIGVSFGLLVAVLPALAMGTLSVLVSYLTDRRFPVPLAVALALGLVGVGGYYTEVISVSQPALARLAAVAVVAVLLTLLAVSQGERVAERVPRGLHGAIRPERTLSTEATDAIDGNGRIEIRPTGEVTDVDGHSPLPPTLRSKLADTSVRLPADLPVSELETRFEDRLRDEFNLAEVSVSIDSRGRATVAAAPRSSDLSRQVRDGYRAVSVRTLAPAGLTDGDEVRVVASETTAAVNGTVLSVTVLDEAAPASEGSPGTECRVTVSVPTAEAGALLDAEQAQVVAVSAGTTDEFEAFSLLEEVGRPVRKVEVGDEDHEQLREADVELLAVRGDEEWSFEPELSSLRPGQLAFVSGSTSSAAIRRFDPDVGGER